ncbi:sugar phosphate isomerase/epimerase [Vallitalea pronyensis]|uniref:Sugar phosphate isomerase/epimerase n=1 Tax=Vallitalea pronyensis TaxID=1348613 RepID=A0A8J8SHC9_9FIRM|nr:TIM barrel protein [Vallitalea pronyensis]QUI23740.1 sugar phosphate isomerase/epimerase [Vallitalea pronyensis]
MQLGIIASSTEESFIMAQNKNLSFIELCVNVDQDVHTFTQTVNQINDWVSLYDVQIGSIGRWGADRIDEKGQPIEEELQREYQLINACQTLGCPVYITGCNAQESLSYLDNCQAALHYFQKLITYGQERGIKIATYNCRWNNFVCEERAWQIIHGQLKDLGIKYDASHSYYANNDNYLSEIANWGHRFYHVHIKGALKVDGQRYDDPPAGMDQLDWRSIMAILYKVGYNGSLSIEPHSTTWRGTLGDKGVDFTIEFIKNYIL